VLYSYSGARPLPLTERGVSEGAISRRAFVIDHESEGVAHLISVVGGKLTTATRLGASVGRAVRRVIGAPPRGGRPQPLPRGQTGPIPFLPQPTVEHLQNRYGRRAAEVAAYAALHPELADPLSPWHPDIGAQVAYAVDHEGAKTVGDVLLRRTPVGLTHDLGRAAAPNVAAIMQGHFDWSDAERDQAVRDYEMELHRTVVVFDHPNRRAATAAVPRTRPTNAVDETHPASN
jgi:glycerol-3-phosphate dehydrogenase